MRALVNTIGLDADTYASFREFLDAYRPDQAGCLVLDVRMPGMSGIEGLETLKAQGIAFPVIVITGYGDVLTAVRAMKGGAVEFFEKPFNNQELLDAVQRCVTQSVKLLQDRDQRDAINARRSLLTPRESQVMDLVVAGEPNRAIALQLEIARRTVEVHRAQVMKKMGAGRVQDLVRMAELTHTSENT